MKVFKGLDLQKHYQAETEKARLEMVEAIKERDKVLNEIADQRVGVNKTVNVLNKKQIEKNDIILLVDSLNLALKQKREFFHDLTDKQIAVLDKLKENINNKYVEDENLSQEIKEKSKIAAEIRSKKKESKELSKEISSLKNQKTNLEVDIAKREKSIERKEKNLEDRKFNFSEYEKGVRKKEKNLDKKEIRLDKLKKELISKK